MTSSKSQSAFVYMATAMVVLLASLWFLLDIWLIIFASILVAVVILSLVACLKNLPVLGRILSKLPHQVLVCLVLVLFLVVTGGIALLFGQEFMSQFEDMKDILPEAVQTVHDYIINVPHLGNWIVHSEFYQTLQDTPMVVAQTIAEDSLASVPAILGYMVSGTITALVIVLLGIFLAFSPRLYTKGMIALVPIRHRNRATYLLEQSFGAMQQWLLGQLVVMGFVGLATWLGLYLLKIPFALVLGVIAFALDFVPVVGPWLTAVPLLLVALIFAPDKLLWVLALTIIIQQLESYVVSPIVQQRLVDLPPVVLLLSQFIMGSLAGILGVAMATPLSVVFIIWVQILYVKFTLTDYKVRLLGQSDLDMQRDKYADTRLMATIVEGKTPKNVFGLIKRPKRPPVEGTSKYLNPAHPDDKYREIKEDGQSHHVLDPNPNNTPDNGGGNVDER